ncbi:MAG: NADH:ubiquinone oxidoreductase subunit E [Oceanicoccus sp.]|jgi:NADH:ubiquinone oxidoreductase subunit E
MHIVKVCTGKACSKNFGNENLKRAEKMLGIKAGETTADGHIHLESTGCIGYCSQAPNVYFGSASPLSMTMNDGTVENKISPPSLEKKLQKLQETNN